MIRPIVLRRLGAAVLTLLLAACGASASGGGGGGNAAVPPTNNGGGGGNPASGAPAPPAPAGMARYSGPPVSLAFPTWDSSLAPIIAAALQPQDYISREIANGNPALVQVVGWSHVFETGNNTAESSQAPYPERSLELVTNTNCPGSGIMLYNIEHWIYTPQAQQLDPAGSIIQAVEEIDGFTPCAGSATSTYVSGFAPDGIFNGASGSNSCNYTLSSNGAFYNETATGLTQGAPIGGTTWINSGPGNDWLNVGIYDAQVQILMSTNPSNLCYGTIANWVNGVQALINLARTGNPNIKIWTELSLKDENWITIANALTAIQGQPNHPDVYYLSFPNQLAPGQVAAPLCPTSGATPPPHSLPACTYETPANLQAELYYMGRATPPP
jgi:hypothetical protein